MRAATRCCWIYLAILATSSFLGASALGNVTLESLTIFRTHEWLGKKPSLYFQCSDEPKVELPDVKNKDQEYKFLGHESWQPLTSLEGTKCKRCGVYEKNELLKDGVFDEWELCPDAFGSDDRYVHFKEAEFNATFLAVTKLSESYYGPAPSSGRKSGLAMTVMIVLFILLLVLGVGVVAYTKWQQKKREEQQARFIKLFEEDDDFDMELGL